MHILMKVHIDPSFSQDDQGKQTTDVAEEVAATLESVAGLSAAVERVEWKVGEDQP